MKTKTQNNTPAEREAAALKRIKKALARSSFDREADKATRKDAPRSSTTWGTSHFESRAAAVHYYEPQGYSVAQVSHKLAMGEIHIGPPTLKPGQTLSLHREERRYFITEAAQ